MSVNARVILLVGYDKTMYTHINEKIDSHITKIRARAQFFDPIFEGNFGSLLVLKMGHAAYRRKAPDVYLLMI